MTDEYSGYDAEQPAQPEEPSAPPGAAAESPQYGVAPRPPFGTAVPVPAAKPPFHRRTGVLLGIAAAAVVVVAGGVGFGLSHGSSSNTAGSAAAAPAQSGTGYQQGRGHHHRMGHALVGTIAAENGDTWTINAADGTSTTVTITPTTRFGTRADQETQSQFVVGNQVAVRGGNAGGVVTARWVGQPGDLQSRHTMGAGATATAPQDPSSQPN